VDASGNRKLPAIGEFLKNKIVEYFKEDGLQATVKYIDPSYMIRYVSVGNEWFLQSI
jgi:6-phosphofructokinase 1